MRKNKADRDFEDNTPITWAPKVRPEEIRRLYKTDAMGIVNEELIDGVGCGLYARCRTIWIATERRCLECTAKLAMDKIGNYSVYVCLDCGWTVRRRRYRRSWRKKRIIGGRAYPAFLTFMKEFSNAKDYRQKILAIDRVIHAVHENLKERLTLPAACNLIEGNEEEILNFLDELAYGDASTAGMKSTKEMWQRKMQAAKEARRKHHEMQEVKGESHPLCYVISDDDK